MDKLAPLKRATALFDTALALAPTDRKSWLAALAVAEPAAAAKLQALLAAHERSEASGFLEVEITPESVAASAATAPSTLGPYQLIRPIGEGGMSTVWLATRDYGSFRKQVAIKQLPALFATPTHAAILQREAAILARLDHPHIAQFLDADIRPNTAPHLVLEYIDGVAVTDWCDARLLGVRERVTLALDVCEAVAYLHKNSIVHRDIKPQNVLVDAAGRVKLLDFGIAKLVDEAVQGFSVASGHTVHAYTPEYAAPEQVTGGTITTQTDVYALGVLIYRLLTGCRPYARDAQSLRLANAVVDSPATPASALFGAGSAVSLAEQAALAKARGATPNELNKTLKNDLDTVLLKALEKPPERRYAHVGALASDLRRWLSHRPIEARRASIAYSLQKFVARHAVASTVTAVMMVGLVGTLTYGVWQARQTQWEAARTQRVLAFLQTLLGEASPNATGQQTISVLQLLEKAPAVAQRQFPDDAALQFEVLRPVERILRDLEAAESLAPVGRAMVALMPRVDGLAPAEAAELQSEYAMTLAFLGQLSDAEREMDAALARLAAAGHSESAIAAQTQMRRAALHLLSGQSTRAADMGLAAYQLLQRHTAPGAPQRTAQVHDLLEMLLQAERFQTAAEVEAADFTNAAIARVPDEKQRLQFQTMQASMRWYLGDPRAGDDGYARLLPPYARFFGKRNVMYPQLLVLHARTSIESARYEQALRLLEEAIAIERQAASPRPGTLVTLHALQATALLHVGQVGAAESTLRRAGDFDVAKRNPQYWRAVFDVAMQQKDWSRAQGALTERMSLLSAPAIGGSLDWVNLELDRADWLHRQGRVAEAKAVAEAPLARLRAILPTGHAWRARAEKQAP